jgi:hypothetical protein
MSRSIVRRLTAAVALVTVLCFAMPAGAASPNRSPSHRPPVVLGSGLLDQFLSWLGSLWSGQVSRPANPGEKSTVTSGEDTSSSDQDRPVPMERGGMIDPNG